MTGRGRVGPPIWIDPRRREGPPGAKPTDIAGMASPGAFPDPVRRAGPPRRRGRPSSRRKVLIDHCPDLAGYDQALVRRAAGSLKGHPRSLVLLGSYLDRQADETRSQLLERLCVESRGRDKALGWFLRIYESWLEASPSILQALRVLALFERSAKTSYVNAIRKQEASIAGITENLANQGDGEWLETLEELKRLNLLTVGEPAGMQTFGGGTTLAIPPEVRDHLAGSLRERFEEPCRKCHQYLYEINMSKYNDKIRDPDQLSEMLELCVAAYHGCQAAKGDDFLDVFMHVYWRCMQRGSDRYNTYMLGRPGIELVALSICLGSLLCRESLDDLRRKGKKEGVEKIKRFYVLGLEERGLQYWHLARFEEACASFGKAFVALDQVFRQDSYPDDRVMIQRRLGEIYLYWGNMEKAELHTHKALSMVAKTEERTEGLPPSDAAQETPAGPTRKADGRYLSIEFDRELELSTTENINWYEPVDAMVQRARYFDLVDQPDEAEKLFNEARTLAQKVQHLENLTSVWLLWHAEHLINRGKFLEARIMAQAAINAEEDKSKVLLKIVQEFVWQYAYAAGMIEETKATGQPLEEDLVVEFERHVAGLEKTGQLPHLPYGWLAMAKVYQAAHRWDQAFRSLEETRLLSCCFEMRLHETDCYLGYAEFYHARSHSDSRERDDLKMAGRYLADAFQRASELKYRRSLGKIRRLAEKIYGTGTGLD